jgi:hypothetical protein
MHAAPRTQITAPGEYVIPMAAYLADPAPQPSLSSGLAQTLLDRSPLDAWNDHPRLNPARVERDSGFDIGTTAHALLLEGDETGLVVVDADDWRTNAAKAKRAEAHAAGKTALLAKHADAVRAMVETARDFIADSEFADDWREAESERTIVWEEDGVWMRARPDRRTNDRRIVFDYKTTGDASPRVFSKQLVMMGYHFQDAFYRRGIRALGYSDPAFVFLAQETEAPYQCAFYRCDPMLREIAELKVENAIDRWRACITANNWPGFERRVHHVEAPYWLRMEHEEAIANG